MSDIGDDYTMMIFFFGDDRDDFSFFPFGFFSMEDPVEKTSFFIITALESIGFFW